MEPDKDTKGAPTEGEKPGAEDAPKYTTEGDLQKLVGARVKALEQKFEKTLAEAIEGMSGRLRTELAALMPAKPEPPSAPGDAKKKEIAPALAEHPEIKQLHEQLGDLKKREAEARAERDAERAKAKDVSLRQEVTAALGAVGIDGLRARHALALLVDAEKRIRWSEAGDALVFRGADDEETDLGPGLKAWLRTDDGKFYAPPRGAAGSGDRGGGNPPRAPGAVDRASLGEALARALRGGL